MSLKKRLKELSIALVLGSLYGLSICLIDLGKAITWLGERLREKTCKIIDKKL